MGFTTAAALVHELTEARDERRLLNLQRQLSRLNLLIIDATGGWCRRVFHYRPPTPMYSNSPPLCTSVL